MKFNGQNILAIAGVILGISALFLGSPYKQPAEASFNDAEIQIFAKNDAKKVSVNQLADWIIQAKSDFRLIDTREEKEFLKYFIPTAENIPLSQLLKSDLQKNEKIIVYSENNLDSSKSWIILDKNGYKGIRSLKGGIKSWKDEILFPKSPKKPTAEEYKEYQRASYVSKFFGGTPQSDGMERKAIKLPVLQAPSKALSKRKGKKKKREGC
jgi:rhodanese-related sulfurtransferase